MEVLRHLRPKGLVALLALIALAFASSACAGPQPAVARPVPAGHSLQWPVKQREHVDLWLHAFALITNDTATVPLFARGYRDHVTVVKNSRNIYTGLDSVRQVLASTLISRPELQGTQFLALYFGTWEEMRQAFEYFFIATAETPRAQSEAVKPIVEFLRAAFPRAEDRAFARTLIGGVEAERAAFHHAWWLEEQRAANPVFARADSLWQSTWRPAIQRYLNHTQQQSGDLILARTLGGEGRAVPAGKSASQYAVAWPRTIDSVDVVLFTFVHEAASAVANVAINDNLTPVQQREGAGARLASAGLVRGGAILLQRIDPALAERYARYYLSQMGRPVPGTGALAALEAAFPMPEEMIASMKRQVEAAFGGI
jgi:hypothetical protein